MPLNSSSKPESTQSETRETAFQSVRGFTHTHMHSCKDRPSVTPECVHKCVYVRAALLTCNDNSCRLLWCEGDMRKAAAFSMASASRLHAKGFSFRISLGL